MKVVGTSVQYRQDTLQSRVHKIEGKIDMRTEADSLERTISVRFLGIFLRVLRLEVCLYNVYITNQFQATFDQRRGSKSLSRDNCERQG
jgi:hypothetical protein